MTAQKKEKLLYEGKIYEIATEPLGQYLNKRKDLRIISLMASSDCWRGYNGDWEIIKDQLFLVKLSGLLVIKSGKGSKENTTDLFPDQEKIFADWFSGEIRIPMGNMLEYVHFGYFSIYEKDMYLQFENGILTGKREIDNKKKYIKTRKKMFNPKTGLYTIKKSFWERLFSK